MENTIIECDDYITNICNQFNGQLFYELIEHACKNIEDYLHSSPFIISNENFEDILDDNMFELFHASYYNIIVQTVDEEYVDVVIKKILSNAYKLIYKHIIPKRSFPISYIRILPNIESISKKIEIIRNIPQPDQRTEEWYMFRHNLITASNAYKCLENEKKQNEIIYEKCLPFKPREETGIVNTSTPFHWGHKYEPLSVEIYEKKYNTRVEDFGCIQHPEYPFIGASPDGIVVNETSKRFGRMLEIKNPISRIITGIPKNMYWVQMQLQMEVCNLNECDFLECEFDSYKENEQEFLNETDKLKEYGIIISYKFVGDEEYKYKYSNLSNTKEEMIDWKNQEISNFDILVDFKIEYWKIRKYNCQRVYRDVNFFNEKIEDIHILWDKIEYFKKEENKSEFIKTIVNNKKKKVFDFSVNTTTNSPPLTGFAFKAVNNDYFN